MNNLTTWQWLTSDAGLSWLDEMADSQSTLHAQVTRLRKSLTAEQAQRVLEQVNLRRRAATRFRLHQEMFFTEKGLEQATDETLARYKARRFGESPVIDLCCGIGGDLLALAARGPTLGVDRDPICVHLANASLERCLGTNSNGIPAANAAQEAASAGSFRGASVGDVEQLSVLPDVAIHIDPDRRAEGRRTTRIDFHSPSRERLRELDRAPRGPCGKTRPRDGSRR